MAEQPAAETPSAGQPAAVQVALESLRRRFLSGLPARWAEIADSTEPEARAAALHRLAGAAGAYGLHELGQAARRAERACEESHGAGLAELERQMQALGVTVR